MDGSTVLALDIGNTRIKGALAVGGRLGAADSFLHGSGDLAAWLRRLGGAAPDRILIASVVPRIAEHVRAVLRELGWRVDLALEDALPIFAADLMRHHLETPQTTGVDRILSALAATRRAPGRRVFVVDCGSAVTVNLVDETATFLGGAILPGFRLMGLALNQGTAALPQVDRTDALELPGRSTRAAIAAGIRHAVVGGVRSLLTEMAAAGPLGARGSADENAETPLFLTGGDAPRILPFFSRGQLVESLVLEGLLIADECLSARTT